MYTCCHPTSIPQNLHNPTTLSFTYQTTSLWNCKKKTLKVVFMRNKLCKSFNLPIKIIFLKIKWKPKIKISLLHTNQPPQGIMLHMPKPSRHCQQLLLQIWHSQLGVRRSTSTKKVMVSEEWLWKYHENPKTMERLAYLWIGLPNFWRIQNVQLKIM
jgi:hypothetical protein